MTAASNNCGRHQRMGHAAAIISTSGAGFDAMMIIKWQSPMRDGALVLLLMRRVQRSGMGLHARVTCSPPRRDGFEGVTTVLTGASRSYDDTDLPRRVGGTAGASANLRICASRRSF